MINRQIRDEDGEGDGAATLTAITIALQDVAAHRPTDTRTRRHHQRDKTEPPRRPTASTSIAGRRPRHPAAVNSSEQHFKLQKDVMLILGLGSVGVKAIWVMFLEKKNVWA